MAAVTKRLKILTAFISHFQVYENKKKNNKLDCLDMELFKANPTPFEMPYNKYF